jgi:hypothetical protein
VAAEDGSDSGSGFRFLPAIASGARGKLNGV